MLMCKERGSHLIHLYDALPEEHKIVIAAIAFFIIGALTVLYILKQKQNEAFQREEELIEMDKEIMEQLREIELMRHNHERDLCIRETIEYEKMLEEMELPDFII